MLYKKRSFLKTSKLIIILICLGNFQVIKAQYTKLDISNVTHKQKEVALKIIDISYRDCQKYKNEGLSSKIASPYFKERFATIKAGKSCSDANKNYGKISSLELAAIVKKNSNYFLRYKVKRSKTDWFSEIRVILNKKNKAVGLIQKNYWSDRIYGYNERLKPFKIEANKLNDSIIEQQQYLINKSYTKCIESEIFNDTIQKILNISVKDRWKNNTLKGCKEIKKKLGNISNISFKEYYTDSIAYNRYRYKVQFDSLKKPSEIRLYARLNNTYTGLFVIDVWYDDYFGLKEAIEKSRNELGN